MEGVSYVLNRIKVFHSDAAVGRVEGNPKGKARVYETDFSAVASKDSIEHHQHSFITIVYTEDTKQKLFDFYNSMVQNIVADSWVIEIEDRKFYEAEKPELYAIEIEIKVINANAS